MIAYGTPETEYPEPERTFLFRFGGKSEKEKRRRYEEWIQNAIPWIWPARS